MEPVKSDYLNVLLGQIEAGKKRKQLALDALSNNSAANSSLPTTGPVGQGNAGAQPTGNVASWIQRAGQVMGRQFSPQEMSALATIIQKESGGNPNAINRWDSNAKKGTPSQGLMQTIPGTFKAYAMPGYNTNITDPISNIIAGVRYLQGRYGGILNHPGLKNMSSGGGYRGY